MTRAELEHVLRAAGAITGRKEWVVVGSQAILGSRPDAPAEVLVSQEADLNAPGDDAASDLIDGTIGERSPAALRAAVDVLQIPRLASASLRLASG